VFDVSLPPARCLDTSSEQMWSQVIVTLSTVMMFIAFLLTLGFWM
jgi:hypothetical protein